MDGKQAFAARARVLAFAVAGLWPALAFGAPPPRIAVFGFELENTSPADSTPAELDRTRRLGMDFAAALQQSGRYTVIGPDQADAALVHGISIRGCNGCERDAAAKLNAPLVAYGWVQKVSNLILNLNVVIEEAGSGRQVGGGSVDIRGNTDESWNHGLKFLLEEHVLAH